MYKDLLENADVKEALELCRNLTEDEQRQFDSFWDMDFLRKDRDMTMENIGREKGRAEGEKLGLEKGRADAVREMAKRMK
jgi:hypothetical protein